MSDTTFLNQPEPGSQPTHLSGALLDNLNSLRIRLKSLAVVDLQGHVVGTVEDLILDTTNCLNLVISQVGSEPRRVLLDSKFIQKASAREKSVFVNVREDDFSHLPEYHGSEVSMDFGLAIPEEAGLEQPTGEIFGSSHVPLKAELPTLTLPDLADVRSEELFEPEALGSLSAPHEPATLTLPLDNDPALGEFDPNHRPPSAVESEIALDLEDFDLDGMNQGEPFSLDLPDESNALSDVGLDFSPSDGSDLPPLNETPSTETTENSLTDLDLTGGEGSSDVSFDLKAGNETALDLRQADFPEPDPAELLALELSQQADAVSVASGVSDVSPWDEAIATDAGDALPAMDWAEGAIASAASFNLDAVNETALDVSQADFSAVAGEDFDLSLNSDNFSFAAESPSESSPLETADLGLDSLNWAAPPEALEGATPEMPVAGLEDFSLESSTELPDFSLEEPSAGLEDFSLESSTELPDFFSLWNRQLSYPTFPWKSHLPDWKISLWNRQLSYLTFPWKNHLPDWKISLWNRQLSYLTFPWKSHLPDWKISLWNRQLSYPIFPWKNHLPDWKISLWNRQLSYLIFPWTWERNCL